MPGPQASIKSAASSTDFSHHRLLAIACGFFLLIQFPVNADIASTLSFYLVMLPAFLWYCTREKEGFSKTHRFMWPVILLFLYIVIHAISFNYGSESIKKTLLNTIATYAFVLATTLFFALPHKVIDRIVRIVVIVAGVAAYISIIIYLIEGSRSSSGRLVPLGRADHEVLGASVYAAAGLLALFYIKNHPRDMAVMICFLLCGAVVLLTQSRMPVLAFSLCVMLCLLDLVRHERRLLYIALISMFFFAVVLLGTTLGESIIIRFETLATGTGSGFRAELWKAALLSIQQHPWLGVGMRAGLGVATPEFYEGSVINSPHNLYIATAYYLGIPALGLLSFILIQAMVYAWRIRTTRYGFFPLIFLLLALLQCLTDHAQIVKGPSPLWIIFWLPLCMTWGVALRYVRGFKSTVQANPS
ncbi:MAG: O-antigen ligase family protein [Rickettsiales bacterium]|jgi:O-antigen ligase|nr:O-antigen ligase family protein [Rickettsiales bacterium]